MNRHILAVCLDSGDTLVDEGTEVREGSEIVLRAGLIPGAAEMVHELKRRGYPLALVADGYTTSFKNVLGSFLIYNLFDAYAISEEVEAEKPDPRMFTTALKQLNISPEQYERVIMVGNNLERDIAGANALGMLSVFIDWAPRRSKIPANDGQIPTYTIHTPLELLDLLDRLENN